MNAKHVLTSATQEMIARRRKAAKDEKAALSKLIRKSIRKDIRSHKRALIVDKIDAFKDLRTIRGIQKVIKLSI